MLHEAVPEHVEQDVGGVPLHSIPDPQVISSITSSDKRKTPLKNGHVKAGQCQTAIRTILFFFFFGMMGIDVQENRSTSSKKTQVDVIKENLQRYYIVVTSRSEAGNMESENLHCIFSKCYI